MATEVPIVSQGFMGAFWILQVFLSKFWTIQFAAARYQHKNYLVIIFDTNIFVYYVYRYISTFLV